MIHVEKAQIRGLGQVADMEVATQEFTKQVDEIKKYFTYTYMPTGEKKDVFLASIGKRAVGHAFVTFEPLKKIAIIDGIGTHPNYRRLGAATTMVEHIGKTAAEMFEDALSGLRIQVVSYQVEDKNDPWNIEGWLWKTGFKAAGVQPGACRRYMHDYDLYTFEKLI
ncbi:MAG: GNAT family N-acetyltransferase [Planctomycetota bacterium]|jgi:hypothetical protein